MACNPEGNSEMENRPTSNPYRLMRYDKNTQLHLHKNGVPYGFSKG